MAFLESVAARIEKTNALIDDLERQVADAAISFTPAPTPSPLDAPDLASLSEDEIVRLLGEETAHVLSTARRASEEIRSKAEVNAERMIRESTADAQRMISEAEATAASLTAAANEAHDKARTEAEAAARSIIDDATAEADRRIAESLDASAAEQARADTRRAEAAAEAARAKTDADEALAAARALAEETRIEAEAEAAVIIERARDEGRSMVAEAKDVRTRVLEDLVRRREIGRSQIERLMEGRDRLVEAYANVRDNVDAMTAELVGVLQDPEPDPALEAGFVGIITSATEDDDIDVTLDGGDTVPADGDVADETAATEDAPTDDAAAEVATDDVADEAPTEDEPVIADEVAATAPEEAEVDAPVEEAVEAEGGVDALFARIKTERAEFVARAQQVLAGDTVDEPAAEPVTDDSAEVEAEALEAAEPTSDVDRVPAELLASGESYEHRNATVERLDRDLSRALKRQLAQEQNVVLDALRITESTDVAALLPIEADHIGGYAAAALGPLLEAATAGASLIDPSAEVDVTELAESMATTLIETFRRRIERSASEVDGDADALDERLRALYREWKVDRIGAATTDALLTAYAEGQLAAAPEESSVRWLIDPEQGPCPDAQDNALAGAVVAGEAFPTGDACPQAHPGCRCLLAVDS